MLVNLDFLETGGAWPPLEEKDRLLRYEQNKLLFEGKHEKIYKEQFKRIERLVGNFEDIISYPVIVNFHRLISLKTADLLLGETPKIVSKDQQESINDLVLYTDFLNTCYQVALDVSRYGTGVFLLYKDKNNKGFIDITQPGCWFPVVDENNIKNVLYHILAWVIKTGEDEILNVQIHEQGFFTHREYLLENGNIGAQLSEDVVKTEFNDFAVIPIHNILTSENIYGIDDYSDIDSVISEIEVRISQISNVLDKHSSPTMTGPSSALTEDENGNYSLKTGNYIVNDASFENQNSDIKYITWDAKLDANFKQLDRLMELLYMLSETGATLLDGKSENGRAESGTALRLRMISPLAKINRIRMKFDPAMKKALALASSIGWEKVEYNRVNIIWRDGLPNDPKEDAEIMQMRTGGKPTISQKEAIKRQDELDDIQTEVMLEEIKNEWLSTNDS